MANAQRGLVEVELDRVRHIRFTLNALAELEEALGVPLDKIDQALAQGGVKTMRKLLWIGLKHEDPELTEEQVGDMVDMSTLMELQGKLYDAFGAAIGNPGNGRAGASGPGPRRKS